MKLLAACVAAGAVLLCVIAWGAVAGGEPRPTYDEAVDAVTDAAEQRAYERVCGETLGTDECERRWEASLR